MRVGLRLWLEGEAPHELARRLKTRARSRRYREALRTLRERGLVREERGRLYPA